MENQHLKPTDARIDEGVAGLRTQAMPSPPERLVYQMIANKEPNHSRQPWNGWKAVAVCGGVGLAVFVAMPQKSSAAEALDRVVASHRRSNVMFHLTSYWIEGKSRTPKIWSGYVMGDRWRYVQSDYEEASDGERVMSYQPLEGRARVWTNSPSDTNARSVLADADLGWWKSMEHRGLTLEHDVKWNGRRVDRYMVTTTSKAWGPTTNILYADPAADLPLYAESLHASGNGSALQWDYVNPADESLLQIKMKPGTKVEDVTVERQRTKRKGVGNPQSAKASKGGRP